MMVPEQESRRSIINASLRPSVGGEGSDEAVRPVWRSEYVEDMPAIIVLTSIGDGCGRYFRQYAESRGVPTALLYVETLKGAPTWWEPGQRRQIWAAIEDRQRGSRPGVYFRVSWSRDAGVNRIIEVITDMLALYDGPVVNRPNRSTLNGSKPLQAVAFSLRGSQPVSAVRTLVTNQLDTIFCGSSTLQVIKSISGIRSEAVAMNDRRINHSRAIPACPVQMQPKLQGVNVRAHVYGESVTAVTIASQALDYRYGQDDPEVKPIHLPEAVAQWCIEAARAEDLELAGIDLMVDEATGEWMCFEVNPTPGYDYFEERAVRAGAHPVVSEWLLQRLGPTLQISNRLCAE